MSEVQVAELPVPPARLRVLVTGTSDLDRFLRTGRAHAALVADMVKRSGTSLPELDAILDFGCGCGRVARWWADLSGPEIYACDYNGELVDWCAQNLPFMKPSTTALQPPLPYANEMFDLVHSYSVFTHLSPDLQARWMAELHRVLRPDGLLLVTLQGDASVSQMSSADRARYMRGEPITEFDGAEGSNICLTYHPPSWVENHLLADFELIEHAPGGEELVAGIEEGGAVRKVLEQDRYLARRTRGRQRTLG